MLLTSAEKKNKETINQLVDLWKTVFGDDEKYIRLFEPYLENFDVFVVKEDGKIVSAFYLLGAEIKKDCRVFKGKYLYAAATYEEYRSKGYMSSLINEAVLIYKNKVDFISLVPADEGLYSYYGRFGFKALMYNYRTNLRCESECRTDGIKTTNGSYINNKRRISFDNLHLLTDITMEYAVDCYGYFGSYFKRYDDAVILYVDDEKTLYEAIAEEKSQKNISELIKNLFSGEITVITQFSLNENSEKIKCGMICAFSDELENTDEIYMNHTLM